MENKIKHLEIIQSVINRMAKNSFSLKGWAVTLTVGIIAIVARQDIQYWLICLIPLFSFWVLDSYYLSLERKYRALYEEIRIKKEEQIDFAMKVNIRVKDVCKTLMSFSEIMFYGAVLFGIVLIAIVCKVVA